MTRIRVFALAMPLALGAQAGTRQSAPAAPLSTFAYDRSAPIGLEQTPSSETATSRVSRITFASPAGGRATGLLIVPKAPGRYPGVVFMHGMPGSAQSVVTNHALPVAERGAVVIALDAPFARRQGEILAFTASDSAEQVQLIKDLQRAVDVLIAQPGVDSARIGYVGGSYGGAMGALFVGIERRLKAAVLFVPDGGLVAHFTDGDQAIGPLGSMPAAQRDRWLAAMRPIEPIRFVHRATIPLLLQNGRQDQAVSPSDAEELHKVVPGEKTVLWYDAGHGLTPQATRDRLEWIAERLGMARGR